MKFSSLKPHLRPAIVLFFVAWPMGRLASAPLIPLDDGMTWYYHLTQEAGEGYGFSAITGQDEAKIQRDVVYRLTGTQEIDGKKLLKFEMHREGAITNTDLMTVDDHGINCWARIDLGGQTMKLDPAQTIVAAPLKKDTAWDFNGKMGDSDVHQHYQVLGEEQVVVPAGKFNAFHIRGQQTAPNAMTIDRWFVNGTGIVKDVTSFRTESGDLIRLVTLELTTRPQVAPRPVVQPPTRLTVSTGKEAMGDSTEVFPADAPKICVRWQGHGVRAGAKIRAVWVAEYVDVAPENYTVDEATAVATIPEARGVFTLSRPPDGWAPGIYRVEFYVDDQLTEAVKLKINP